MFCCNINQSGDGSIRSFYPHWIVSRNIKVLKGQPALKNVQKIDWKAQKSFAKKNLRNRINRLRLDVCVHMKI